MKKKNITPSLKPLRDTVLSSIDANPKPFFKNLSGFLRYELNWSVTLKKWQSQKLPRIRHILASKKLPGELNIVMNIMKCLDKYYPIETGPYSYGNKTLSETAFIIYDFYKVKIFNILRERYKWGSPEYETKHTIEEIDAELRARGFMIKEDLILNLKLPFIRANHNLDLRYPEQFELNAIHENLDLIGVPGTCGIRVPKKFRKKIKKSKS